MILSGDVASSVLNNSSFHELPISNKEVTIKGDQCSIENQGSYAMVLDATKNKKGDKATYHIHLLNPLLNPYNLDSTKLQEEIPNTLREENKVCSVTVKEKEV